MRFLIVLIVKSNLTGHLRIPNWRKAINLRRSPNAFYKISELQDDIRVYFGETPYRRFLGMVNLKCNT